MTIWQKIKNLFTPKKVTKDKTASPPTAIPVQVITTPESPKPIPAPLPVVDRSKENLEFALKYVFGNEGGYSNHPNDKGGATMWGVTKIEWERFHKRKFTDHEIRFMKLEDAKAIYHAKYWDYAGIDDIHDKYKATAIFDQCVNWGVQVGVDYAARACGRPPHKSIILTIDEVREINAIDRVRFVMTFAEIARSRYAKLAMLPKYWVFRKGWLNRAARLKTLAVNEPRTRNIIG
jgi:lysozyme family protein